MEEIGFGSGGGGWGEGVFRRGKGPLEGRQLGWGCSMGWNGLRFARPKNTRGPTILLVCLIRSC